VANSLSVNSRNQSTSPSGGFATSSNPTSACHQCGTWESCAWNWLKISSSRVFSASRRSVIESDWTTRATLCVISKRLMVHPHPAIGRRSGLTVARKHVTAIRTMATQQMATATRTQAIRLVNWANNSFESLSNLFSRQYTCSFAWWRRCESRRFFRDS